MSYWDMLPEDLQDKIIQIRNDSIVFSYGLFAFHDHLFGTQHILIHGQSQFHVFYFDLLTCEKKRLKKCYDWNGTQYVNFPVFFKHKLKLYAYMLERL